MSEAKVISELLDKAAEKERRIDKKNWMYDGQKHTRKTEFQVRRYGRFRWVVTERMHGDRERLTRFIYWRKINAIHCLNALNRIHMDGYDVGAFGGPMSYNSYGDFYNG